MGVRGLRPSCTLSRETRGYIADVLAPLAGLHALLRLRTRLLDAALGRTTRSGLHQHTRVGGGMRGF